MSDDKYPQLGEGVLDLTLQTFTVEAFVPYTVRAEHARAAADMVRGMDIDTTAEFHLRVRMEDADDQMRDALEMVRNDYADSLHMIEERIKIETQFPVKMELEVKRGNILRRLEAIDTALGRF